MKCYELLTEGLKHDRAAVIMRNWGKKHPNLFDKELIE
jgi:hypothetical protein